MKSVLSSSLQSTTLRRPLSSSWLQLVEKRKYVLNQMRTCSHQQNAEMLGSCRNAYAREDLQTCSTHQAVLDHAAQKLADPTSEIASDPRLVKAKTPRSIKSDPNNRDVRQPRVAEFSPHFKA